MQDRARKAYRLFLGNPRHPSVRFKCVHPAKAIYSVRISLECRALGILEGDDIIWFWIGSHADYEKLLP